MIYSKLTCYKNYKKFRNKKDQIFEACFSMTRLKKIFSLV